MAVSYVTIFFNIHQNADNQAMNKLAFCVVSILDQVHFIPRKSDRYFEKV
jgi:hypothetical protein